MAQINKAGEDLVFSYEQYREFAYPDPASPLAKATRGMRARWGYRPAREIIAELDEGVKHLHGNPWTCGIGRTRGVTIDTRMSEAEAWKDMRAELDMVATQVRDACKIEPNENELAAMTSLAYNIGMGWSGAKKPAGAKDGFRQSSVLRAHNRGDKQAAARAFRLWNRAGGVEMDGLTKRRVSEADLYLKAPRVLMDPAVDDGDDPTMPQTVDAERPMTQSSINRSALVAGGTAAAATVAETARTVAEVKYSVAQLGDWLLPAMLLVIVALCGYIIYERVRVRKQGWY